LIFVVIEDYDVDVYSPGSSIILIGNKNDLYFDEVMRDFVTC